MMIDTAGAESMEQSVKMEDEPADHYSLTTDHCPQITN